MHKILFRLAAVAMVAGCDDGSSDASGDGAFDAWSDVVLTFDAAGGDGAVEGDGGLGAFGDGSILPDGSASESSAPDSGQHPPTADAGGEDPTTLRANGVGRACDTDADCERGQICHTDLDNYLGHGQCTTVCSASAECTAAHGEETFCIGAEICVAACLTDDDCPEKSICSENGWCMRTGPGSGNPYCSGVATPCSLLTHTQCLTTLGCFDDSECQGVSSSCFSQFTSYSCHSQGGCVWSSYSESCSGSAHSCSSKSGSATCNGQDGCYWDEGCTGTADPCSDFPVSLCAGQPGCSVVY